MRSDRDAELIAPLPRISLHAFCETQEVAKVLEAAFRDRRIDRAVTRVSMGGAKAAVEAFRTAPTPNVIVLENLSSRAELIQNLDMLAEFCDAGTHVLVIGAVNDIVLYRELIARGVSDYMVAPIAPLDFISTVSKLYADTAGKPLGKVIATVGAKGGVGASTIAHNVAFHIARDLHIQTIIADLDLPFGTAGLDFNQDPPQGIAEAVFAPDRLDQNLLDRLLSRCADRLSLLTAPATLDRLYDFSETAFETIVDILRTTTPCVMLDVPHLWTGWARRVVVGADDVLVVAEPELASLRNAKSLIDMLRTARPHDAHPHLVLNRVGVPKRPEIAVGDFVNAVDLPAAATIIFEPKLFGTAANNGQMIVEVEAANKIAESFGDLARAVTGKAEVRKPTRSLLKPLMNRLSRKKAS
jgi:pilus assembly protein CpaE